MGTRAYRVVAMTNRDPRNRSDWLQNVWEAIKSLENRLALLEHRVREVEKKIEKLL